MNMHTTKRLAVLTTIVGMLALAPAAAAGAHVRPQLLCPGLAAPCQQPGKPAKPAGGRSESRPVPHAVTGPAGQEVWRSGTWLMM